MILVYSEAESPRLAYVLAFIGREWFGAPLSHTTDPTVFESFDGPKLQYGGERAAHARFYLSSVSLLFEKGISARPLDFFIAEKLPMLFGGSGDLPFDLFAGIFFLLSRYEEWLPHNPDRYGRFPPEASVAFQKGFLGRPLIEEWMLLFQQRLTAVFSGIVFRPRLFSLLATYDVDMAWSYRGKGALRNAGGLMRDVFNGSLALVYRRAAVLSGKRSDPFDSFAWLDELHKRYRLQPHYFFLLAAKTGRFDKNISPGYTGMKELVAAHSRLYNTGIHPSFQSGDSRPLLEEEISTLTGLSGKPVTTSRQHYLRLSMPDTFRRLVGAGIRNDFSMGYGTMNGFRASFTGDFFWYDLEKEAETGLLLTPFCFMDAAAFYGESLNPAETLEKMRQLRKNIAGVNGRMVTLWHNHLLGDSPQFGGWRGAYARFLGEVCQ